MTRADAVCWTNIMTNIATALETIEHWSLDQQVELAERLRDRLIEQGWCPEPVPAQIAEIERRLAAAEANPADVVTWDEIVTHVHKTQLSVS